VIAPVGGQASAFDHPRNPDVAVNDRGDVSLVWNTYEGQLGVTAGGTYQLKERTRTSGSARWSLPVNIANTDEQALVRLDRSGNATAFYPAGGYIRAAQRAAIEVQWLTQVTLSPEPYVSISGPTGDVNARGDAIAAWIAYPGSGSSAGSVLSASVRVDGRWSTAVQLPTQSRNPLLPAAAIDPAGNAVVVWDDDGTIKAAFRRAASGTWEQPAELGAALYRYVQAQVGFDAAGNATAVWESKDAFRPFGGAWRQRSGLGIFLQQFASAPMETQSRWSSPLRSGSQCARRPKIGS
jgi:hypothetical protein